MRLPKKYQGITPGEWRTFEADFYSPTEYGVTTPSADIAHCSPKFNTQRSQEETKQNATIMADSPRLAAAVVELRDKMNRLANSCDIGAKDAPTKMRPIFSMLSEECRKALESTKEWAE